jgi:hypothetical protein
MPPRGCVGVRPLMRAADYRAAAGADPVAIPPKIESALLVARMVSGEAMRVAPKANALTVAVPLLPDRLIRSPAPTNAPGLPHRKQDEADGEFSLPRRRVRPR